MIWMIIVNIEQMSLNGVEWDGNMRFLEYYLIDWTIQIKLLDFLFSETTSRECNTLIQLFSLNLNSWMSVRYLFEISFNC